MRSEPLITVCIANFNGVKCIDACIQSILSQKEIDNLEIIIHDDASTDDSVEYIKKNYPTILLIESEYNVGFCVANNRMASAAKGQYILFLNNDAELFVDAVHTLLDACNTIERHAIYGLPQYNKQNKQLIDRGAFVDLFLNAVPNLDKNKLHVAMVAGACLWIPTALWNELGGFPEWFESLAEDAYLCSRARLAGYQVMALPTSGYYHDIGFSFGGGKISNHRISSTFKRRAYSERNKLFTILIVAPAFWLWLFFPLQVMLLLLEGVILTVLKRQLRIWVDIYAPLVPSIIYYRKRWILLRCETQQKKNISFRRWLKAVQWQPHKLRMLIKYGVPDIK